MKAPLINRTIAFILIGSRPLLGNAECKYELTCSKYATKQLHTQPLFKAIWRIAKRILSCNPLF